MRADTNTPKIRPAANTFTHDVSLSPHKVVKKFRTVGREEHLREWKALVLLQKYRAGIAPEPLWSDLEARPPVIVMSRLPGRPMGGSPLTKGQVRALAEAISQIQRAIPRTIVRDMPYSISHPRIEIPKLRRRVEAVNDGHRNSSVSHALDAARSWLSGEEPEMLLAQDGAVVFGQSDPNLRNFLWDGRHVRVVDFEDSGRSDVATELADLVEHVTARNNSEQDWADLLNTVPLEQADRKRLDMVRRVKAIYWLLAFLSDRTGARTPRETVIDQAERLMRRLR
jgi:Ser/Thr protein kinase RdoA (MazF antagonist)